MLAKAVTVKEAVERMYNITKTKDKLEYHVSQHNTTQHNTNVDMQVFVPNWDHPESEKWKFIEKLMELFSPTLEAISTFEGQTYITQSLILLQKSHIEKRIFSLQE